MSYPLDVPPPTSPDYKPAPSAPPAPLPPPTDIPLYNGEAEKVGNHQVQEDMKSMPESDPHNGSKTSEKIVTALLIFLFGIWVLIIFSLVLALYSTYLGCRMGSWICEKLSFGRFYGVHTRRSGSTVVVVTTHDENDHLETCCHVFGGMMHGIAYLLYFIAKGSIVILAFMPLPENLHLWFAEAADYYYFVEYGTTRVSAIITPAVVVQNENVNVQEVNNNNNQKNENNVNISLNITPAMLQQAGYQPTPVNSVQSQNTMYQQPQSPQTPQQQFYQQPVYMATTEPQPSQPLLAGESAGVFPPAVPQQQMGYSAPPNNVGFQQPLTPVGFVPQTVQP